jgi:hypothetical protein
MSSIYYDILKLLVATFMAIITTYLNYYNIIPQIGGGRSVLILATNRQLPIVPKRMVKFNPTTIHSEISI